MLVLIFAHSDPKMQKLGFGPVRRSTLADANKSRPLAILENCFEYTLKRAMQVGPKKTGFRFSGNILAVDSTTIELCLSLCPWARFHHGKGAVKLHTAIDIAGDLPVVAVMTEGRIHDMRAARNHMTFNKGDTLVFDRAYNDFAWLNALNKKDIWFVTRTKVNTQFKVMESRPTDRTQGYKCDQTIYLKSQRGRRYEGRLRRVSFREPDTGKWLVFLTNRFDLSYRTICALYKARWKVELFFKTLKQNLRVKKFLGTTINAVKAQILVALIAYLLVQILRFSLKTSISITDAMAVIATLLLLREPVSRLLGELPRITRHPVPLQLCFKFRKTNRTAVRWYYILLMSTGLTFGIISALYGLTHSIVTREQYSFLVSAVIASAVIPTIIASLMFLPKHLLAERQPAVQPVHGAAKGPAEDENGDGLANE